MQVSQVVQTNAASAEECAAANEELSSQADNLKTNASIFKLNTSFADDSNPHKQKSKRSEEQNRKCSAMKNFGKY